MITSDQLGGGGGGLPIGAVMSIQSNAIKVTLPDDTVWIRAGDFETDVASYPDAKVTHAYVNEVSKKLFDLPVNQSNRGLTSDATHYYYLTSNATFAKVDFAGNLVDTITPTANDFMRELTYDPRTNTLWAGHALTANVIEMELDGTATGREYPATGTSDPSNRRTVVGNFMAETTGATVSEVRLVSLLTLDVVRDFNFDDDEGKAVMLYYVGELEGKLIGQQSSNSDYASVVVEITGTDSAPEVYVLGTSTGADVNTIGNQGQTTVNGEVHYKYSNVMYAATPLVGGGSTTETDTLNFNYIRIG